MSETQKHNRKSSVIVIIVGVILIFTSMFMGYLMDSSIVTIVGIAIGAVMVGATGLTDELGWLMGAKNNIDKNSTNNRGRKTKIKSDIEDKLFGELEDGDIFFDE